MFSSVHLPFLATTALLTSCCAFEFCSLTRTGQRDIRKRDRMGEAGVVIPRTAPCLPVPIF